MLHHSSVSWDITPLYFGSWHFTQFQQNLPYQSTNMVKFHVTSRKSKILHFGGLLLQISCKVSAKKVQKTYLSWHWRVMQILRKTDLWFQIWHEEFGKFSLSHLNPRKFHFDGLVLSKVYEIWAKEIKRSFLSWHSAVMQNFNSPWLCGLKNGMRNWVNFH